MIERFDEAESNLHQAVACGYKDAMDIKLRIKDLKELQEN